jgi:protein TorT
MQTVTPPLLGAVMLMLATHCMAADMEEPTNLASYAPVPIYSIYPPLKSHSSADEALASGRVVEALYQPAQPASKVWRIAFLFPHLKDSYWIGCSYGVIAEARRLGVAVDIFPAAGYDDMVGQLRKMDMAIAAKYDAIVISPLSMTANNPSITQARRAGIPVFELANDSSSDDLVIKVTISLRGMGRDVTQWVIQDALSRGMKSVNIGLLPGPAEAGWVQGEVDGTLDAARKSPIKVHVVGIKYGDSDRVTQSQLADRLLEEHGKQIDYILGCTGCVPAAVLPVQAHGLQEHIKIVAYDLTREIAGLIRKGSIVAAADTKGVSQARVTIDAVVDYLEQRNVVHPHTMLIKLGLVAQSNHAEYPYSTSTAPDGYVPITHYAPSRSK